MKTLILTGVSMKRYLLTFGASSMFCLLTVVVVAAAKTKEITKRITTMIKTLYVTVLAERLSKVMKDALMKGMNEYKRKVVFRLVWCFKLYQNDTQQKQIRILV